jgi:hypothetical protein
MERTLFTASGGFDETLKYAMDYDLWLRLSQISEPAYLGFEVAAFRRHAGSTSTANAEKAFYEDHHVRCRHLRRNPISHFFHEVIFRRRLYRKRWNR